MLAVLQCQSVYCNLASQIVYQIVIQCRLYYATFHDNVLH